MGRRPAAVLAVLGLLVALVVAGVASREAGWTSRLPAPATTTAGVATAPSLPPASPSAVPTATASPTRDDDLPPSQALGAVLLVLVGLLVLAGAAWLVTSVVRTTRDLARSGALAPPRSAGTAVRDALAPATAEALREVEQPDAREAVVRCWLLLGTAASAGGLPARPSETAAEYAARIRVELGLPAAELDRLADLYREARFSSHDVGEPQRAEARDLLRRLGERLGRVPA